MACHNGHDCKVVASPSTRQFHPVDPAKPGPVCLGDVEREGVSESLERTIILFPFQKRSSKSDQVTRACCGRVPKCLPQGGTDLCCCQVDNKKKKKKRRGFLVLALSSRPQLQMFFFFFRRQTFCY